MERAPNEKGTGGQAATRCVAQCRSVSGVRQNEAASGIDGSPFMVAQRRKLQSMFGAAAQLHEGVAPQGNFEPVQRVEEEEPLQGKFATAQLKSIEEEEPIQGVFATTQQKSPEEGEPLQGMFMTAQLRSPEEEEPLQGKCEAVQRVDEEETVQAKLASQAPAQLQQDSAPRPNNTGLPDSLKSGIESLSGISMDSVRVHYGSSRPAQLNALAYTQGTDIHVAPGQERHLPHEAWHVVQQAQGRVQPTMQMREGVPVNDDAALEHEADVMGERAIQMMENRKARLGLIGSSASDSVTDNNTPIQRLTHVSYIPDFEVTPRKRVNTVTHTRNGSVSSSAKTWVQNNGAVSMKPGGAVCNHSKPYTDIADRINTELTNKPTINQVCRTVKAWYTNLFSFAQAANALEEGVLDNMTDTNTNPSEPVGDVDSALDWYLSRIADYPNNLFFWPDQQQVGGGIAGITTVNEPGATNTPLAGLWGNRQTRAWERTRLATARGTLANESL